jgi:hypothetical protein
MESCNGGPEVAVSAEDAWKALHLLNVGQKDPQKGLTWNDLRSVGITCLPDTLGELLDRGLINEIDNTYFVSPAARFVLSSFLLSRRQYSGNLWIDSPEVFVAMAFREEWSDRVYDDLIEPAALAAGLNPHRADAKPMIGDIRESVWESIYKAGLVIADISVPNVNVFYEIGLTHAIGKQTVLLKRRDTPLPADFNRLLNLEYDLTDLASGRDKLRQQLAHWAQSQHVRGVGPLLGCKPLTRATRAASRTTRSGPARGLRTRRSRQRKMPPT